MFKDRDYDPATGEMTLSYAFDDGPVLTERLVFPWAPWPSESSRQAAFLRAMDLLHLIAGVSYYKAGASGAIDTGDHWIDESTGQFLNTLYRKGLAEFAFVNNLDIEGRVNFMPSGSGEPAQESLGLSERALVAMGGGKDSLVALEMLRQASVDVQPIMAGSSGLISDTVRAAGLPLIAVQRHLAPELESINANGAWNGHVPVTAINSAICLCAAVLYGYRWIVFANEKSASEPTRLDNHGREVNHQYSKSLEFEQQFRAIVAEFVSPEIEYFSLLRPLTEIAVAKKFASLGQYHSVFSSCNRNFHRDGSRIEGRWCGDCPKCRFTSLALALFLEPEQLVEILGCNLLDDPGQETGYRELCGLQAEKPFECVGTLEESRAAILALSGRKPWQDMSIVRALSAEIEPASELSSLLFANGPHCIPKRLFDRVTF